MTVPPPAEPIMKQPPMLLRDKALSAYHQLLVERYKEYLRYEQLPLRDALRLKLENLFGSDHLIEVEAGASELERWVVIEGLRFLGLRNYRGEIQIFWVVPCPRCGELMTSKSLTSIIDFGREIDALSITGRVSDHECADSAT